MAGLRKLLLRSQDPKVLVGAAGPPSEIAIKDGCEKELSRLTGSIFCLGPGTEQVRLPLLL
jgi:hypothetical protein